MVVLHLHETTEIKGGTEVYLELLQKYFPQHGIISFWFGVFKDENGYNCVDHGTSGKQRFGTLPELLKFINEFSIEKEVKLLNVHGISDPSLIKGLFDILPVIRFLHEPRVFCPGTQKFWRFSEQPCTKPFGMHCLIHAYTEGCCNRHPKRLIPAYKNTQFELTDAKDRYKRMIVMSEYMKNEAILAGIEENKLFVNPYFVEPAAMQTPIIEDDRKIKRVLFLGRFHVTKGISYLIQAFGELVRSRPDQNIILDLVGTGDSKEALERMAGDMQLSGKVVFHGWKKREETYCMLDRTDIVAFPSIYPEAFGIVGIEAMLRGKPVVAFDVGGVNTWLKNGETGFLVKNKDVSGFFKSMQVILEDAQLYDKMAFRAREYAEDHFLPRHHIDKLKAIYSTI